MTADSFTIIPDILFEALERGIITREMYDCLVLLYRWREHESNVVRAVSAERITHAMELHYEKPPSIATVRRWMRGLLYAKWFRRNYKSGRKLPYDVFLNFLGGSRTFGRVRDGVRNGDCEKTEFGDCEKVPISLEDITHWQQTPIFRGRDEIDDGVRDGVRSGVHQMDAKDQQSRPVPIGTVLCTADAAGAIDPRPDLFSPAAPAGGRSSAAGLLESKPAGKENLLTALRKVAARELQNMRAVPKSLKPNFGLMESAHGFSAVVEDFTKWCGENRDRHPKFPLLDYAKACQDRLGEPPVPDASSTDSKPPKPADNPQVAELIQDVYAEFNIIVPDAKKVAILIATYGVDYTRNALWDGVNGIDTEDDSHKAYVKCKVEQKKFIKTFFSESGGLAIVAAYRDQVLDSAAEWLIALGGGEKDAAQKFCRNLRASQAIALHDLYWERERAKRLAAKKKVKP
jgi:hypothetical protein